MRASCCGRMSPNAPHACRFPHGAQCRENLHQVSNVHTHVVTVSAMFLGCVRSAVLYWARITLQVKALQQAVVDKAERGDVLSAVSSLQAALGQKVERADAEAALARKLDVRTFLASQSSVPALDGTLSLGSGGTTAAAVAAPAPSRSRSVLRTATSGPLTPAASLVRAHSLTAARSEAPEDVGGDSPRSVQSPGQLGGRWESVASAGAAARPPLASGGSFAAGRLAAGGAAAGGERSGTPGLPLQSMQAVQQWRERARAATPAHVPRATSGLRTPSTTPKGSQVQHSPARTLK